MKPNTCSARRPLRPMRPLRLAPLALAALLACAPSARAQLPLNAQLVNGSAVINQFSNGLQIINSPGAILNWDSFSIGANRTVRFDQQTALSAVLNRVTGTAFSDIQGTLQSNGRVFLINPNGIVFGAGARVDVAGLVASTLALRDEDFLAGNYRFACANAIACESGVDVLNPNANRILLQDGAQITTRTAGEGGQVWLIARERIVSEKGSRIEAPSGQVIAAAAREVSIASPQLGQMTFTLTGPVGSRIDLAGEIEAPRGAAGFFADTVRLAGPVRALSDPRAAGQIVARAASELRVEGDARLDVSGTPGADAGAIRLSAGQTVRLAPSVDVAADGGTAVAGQPLATGGLIDIEAAQVLLPPATRVVHARGHSAEGPDLRQYGRVDVRETGEFTYERSSLVELTGTGQSTNTAGPVGNGGFQWQSSDSADTHTLVDVAQAGDGQYVVLTVQRLESGVSTSTTAADETHTESQSRSVFETYTLRRIDATGRVVQTLAVGTQTRSGTDTAPATEYSVKGLSQGGWVIVERGGSDRMRFLDASGREAATVALASGSVVQVLASGGVLVDTGDAATRQVYGADGRRVTNAAAVLAAEPPTVAVAPGRPELQFSVQPGLDERRGWRMGADGTTVEYVDRTTGEVERSVPMADLRGLTNGVGVDAIAYPTLTLRGSPVQSSAASGGRSEFSETTSGALLDGQVFFRLPDSSSRRVSERTSASTEAMRYDESLAGVRAVGFGRQVLTVSTLAQQGQREGLNSSSTEARTLAVSELRRVLVQTPEALATVTASAATPPQLATAPGQSNGVREVPPPAPPPPSPPPPGPGPGPAPQPPSPAPPPSAPSPTPAPAPAAAPTAPPVPAAPAPGVALVPEPRPSDLPPPPRPLFEPGPPAPSSMPGVPASVVRDDSGDGGLAEWTQAAEDVVRETLGERGLKRFREAESRREQDGVLAEAGYAQAVGPELYQVTEYMGPHMRQALFKGLGTLQGLGYGEGESDPFWEGLQRALTVKKSSTNPDGTPGVARTPLEVPLGILAAELEQAETPAERDAVRARILREMVIAGREEAGETVDDTEDVVIYEGAKGGTRVVITPEGEVRQTQ